MHEFCIYDDLYSIEMSDFRTKTPSWVKISSEVHPGGRAAHGLAVHGTDLYIFGGLGDEGALGDLWKFNTGKHFQTIMYYGIIILLILLLIKYEQ